MKLYNHLLFRFVQHNNRRYGENIVIGKKSQELLKYIEFNQKYNKNDDDRFKYEGVIKFDEVTYYFIKLQELVRKLNRRSD